MPINNPYFSSIDIKDSQGDLVIELLDQEPIPNRLFAPAKAPGQIAGFYNSRFDEVSLFVVDSSGTRWMKIS